MSRAGRLSPNNRIDPRFLRRHGRNRSARGIGLPGNRVRALVNGTSGTAADTDLRLCKIFGLSEADVLRRQNAADTLDAKNRPSAKLAPIEPRKREPAA